MADSSKEEFVAKLEHLDNETLHFLSTYAEERRRVSNLTATITGIIVSFSGAALLGSKLLPQVDLATIMALSAAIAGIVGAAAGYTRAKQNAALIREVLRHSASLSNNEDAEKKRELIERFLRAEGLQ